MNLTKQEILNGNYIYPSDLVKLHFTKHFKERLAERGLGLECIPTCVRVTKENLHSAKTFDNTHLTSVVVKLKYNLNKYLFICFNPFDGGCKTLWFRNANTKEYRKNIRSSIRDNRGEDKI